jgi:hypothetical protein
MDENYQDIDDAVIYHHIFFCYQLITSQLFPKNPKATVMEEKIQHFLDVDRYTENFLVPAKYCMFHE